MTRQQIQRNVACVLDEHQHSLQERSGSTDDAWNGTKIFLTSDSIDVVNIVAEVLPKGVSLIHNIPSGFIHTDAIKATASNFDKLAMPYLDNYMLGQSEFTASCFTSFGQMGGLRTGGIERLGSIIVLEHHEKSLKGKACVPLSVLLKGKL
jgi:hypothetical protein